MQTAVDALAASLAAKANAVGLQMGAGVRTPFSEAAEKEGYRFPGGKLDDVAVVCGVVCSGDHRRPPPRVGHNFGDLVQEEGVEGLVVPTATQATTTATGVTIMGAREE